MSLPNEIIPVGLLGTGAAEAGAYEIERSVRFNSSDSAYLSRTPSSSGNRTTWTFSCWVKRSNLTGVYSLFSAGTGADVNQVTVLQFSTSTGTAGDNIVAYTHPVSITSTRVFRDSSAWYHIVWALDTTQATASNRSRLYVNGIEITDITGSYPTQNTQYGVSSSGTPCEIGRYTYEGARYFSGLLAECYLIDGQALAPTAFGEFDPTTGVWNPIEYTGTYGTNGFHLPFSDNSTAAALGTDTSGNGNDWAVFNLAIGTDINPGTPSGTSMLSPYPWSNAFDGNFSTRAVANNVSYALATYTFASPITFTSLKLVAHSDGSGDPVKVNGTNITGLPTYPSWSANPNQIVDVTSQVTSPLTSVSVTWNSNSSAGSGIAAVIVNDSVLLLPSAAAQNDSLVDTPTSYGTDTGAGGEVRGNYATLNPLDSILVQSNGNLDYTNSVADNRMARSTISVSTGKWYWECTGLTNSSGSNGLATGVQRSDSVRDSYIGQSANGYAYENSGSKRNNNTAVAYGASWGVNDIVGVAFDADNGTITFYKNGVSQGQAYSGLTSGPYSPAFGAYASSGIANFGQRPFAYTAPSGYKALCTANFDDPVVAQPSTVMDVALWTGNGSSPRSITGLGFNPDFVWIKERSAGTYFHRLFDANRGAPNNLYLPGTNAENTYSSGYANVTSFDSSGFTLTGLNGGNNSSVAYVAWTWDAGSSTVTNTDGSITSSVRANPSAGFSIVTYTGNGTAGATVGHGLGANVGLYFVKNRDSTSNWVVLGHALNDAYGGAKKYVLLDSTAAAGNASQGPGNSSTIELYNDISNNTNGNDYVAYCFAPVSGYSASFSYTGNGSTDGVFQYLGFRPRLILLKCSSTTGNWTLLDTAREGYNVDNDPLYPNLSNAEGTTDLLDITSNGFKLRTTDASVNSSGATYIGFAWAESPFQYSRAR